MVGSIQGAPLRHKDGRPWCRVNSSSDNPWSLATAVSGILALRRRKRLDTLRLSGSCVARFGVEGSDLSVFLERRILRFFFRFGSPASGIFSSSAVSSASASASYQTSCRESGCRELERATAGELDADWEPKSAWPGGAPGDLGFCRPEPPAIALILDMNDPPLPLLRPSNPSSDPWRVWPWASGISGLANCTLRLEGVSVPLVSTVSPADLSLF
jgi:hypothetical protein